MKLCFHQSTLLLLRLYVCEGGLFKINVVTLSWPNEDRLIKETKQGDSEIRREWTNIEEQASKIRTAVCWVASRKHIAL